MSCLLKFNAVVLDHQHPAIVPVVSQHVVTQCAQYRVARAKRFDNFSIATSLNGVAISIDEDVWVPICSRPTGSDTTVLQPSLKGISEFSINVEHAAISLCRSRIQPWIVGIVMSWDDEQLCGDAIEIEVGFLEAANLTGSRTQFECQQE
ncbi:hypothetical protein BL241_00410 [Ralstonia solanacearum]|nr:hypothetical protein BL241_00410 [Ralstonia solanacearum]